jgi:hypothetical protein
MKAETSEAATAAAAAMLLLPAPLERALRKEAATA